MNFPELLPSPTPCAALKSAIRTNPRGSFNRSKVSVLEREIFRYVLPWELSSVAQAESLPLEWRSGKTFQRHHEVSVWQKGNALKG